MKFRVVVAVGVLLLGGILLYMGRPVGALFLLGSPLLLLPLGRWVAASMRAIVADGARPADSSASHIGVSIDRATPVMHPEPVDHSERIFGSQDVRGSVPAASDITHSSHGSTT